MAAFPHFEHDVEGAERVDGKYVAYCTQRLPAGYSLNGRIEAGVKGNSVASFGEI